MADNIDVWRINLVSRIKQYTSTIDDLQSTVNSASYSSDLNGWSVSNVSARLDHFAERLINKIRVLLITALKFNLFFHHLINLR